MAEIPDVIPGEIITADYNNDMRDRSLQRYASTVDRDADNPVPADGDLAFLQTSPNTGDIVQVFTDGAWVALIDATGGTMVAGSLTFTEDAARITFAYAAGTGFNILVPAGTTGELQVRRGVSTWMAFRQDPVNQVFINQELEMNARASFVDGSQADPGMRFRDDTDTGFYRQTTGDLRVTANGAEKMSWRVAGVGSETVYDNTTATAANMNIVGTTFLLRRSTSSGAYKENVVDLQFAPADWDALRPVQFESNIEADPDGAFWGFIAEEVPEVVRAEDNYDVRAIVAMLVVKVKELEGALT